MATSRESSSDTQRLTDSLSQLVKAASLRASEISESDSARAKLNFGILAVRAFQIATREDDPEDADEFEYRGGDHFMLATSGLSSSGLMQLRLKTEGLGGVHGVVVRVRHEISPRGAANIIFVVEKQLED